MLTAELLKNINGLSDEQIAAITKMSENDENTVISKKTREIYDNVDSAIAEISGISKGQTEKTTELIRRAFTDLKNGSEELKTKNEELAKKIGSGVSDDQKVKDMESKYNTLKAMYDSDKAKFAKEVQEANAKYSDAIVGFEFQKAVSGLQINPELPEIVRKTMVEATIGQIKNSYKSEFIDGKLVFRTQEGELLTNPKNNLSPYSAQDLLKESLKDILASDPSTGAGTGSGKKAPENALNKSFKTQSEAMEGIEKHLSSKGIAYGTEAYQNELDKIWVDMKVSELPAQ